MPATPSSADSKSILQLTSVETIVMQVSKLGAESLATTNCHPHAIKSEPPSLKFSCIGLLLKVTRFIMVLVVDA